MRKFVALLMSLAGIMTCGGSGTAAEPWPDVSQWLPPETVIALEVRQPESLLKLIGDDRLAAAVSSSKAYQLQAQTANFRQLLAIVRYLETSFNTDWVTGLQRLTGKGVTIAILPGDAVVMSVDAEDAKLMTDLHELLLKFARDDATRRSQPDRVKSAEYRGVTGWTFGGDEAHVILGNRLLITNKPDALKRLLDRSQDKAGPNLATVPAYVAAQRAAGEDAAAVLYLNMQLLKQHPPVKQALESRGNPLAALLLAGATEALRQSSWLAVGLHVDGDTLTMRATTDATNAQATGVAAFALPQTDDAAARPLVSVPRQIAGMSLYRDLHGFYAAKDQLFPDRTSGLIFFENMMGIFFSGRDLTEEVLAQTGPQIRLVVAEQQYDPQIGTPRVQIPAFAAVLQLRDPEEYRIVAEEAWQKALGLVNFTRGQQGLPGLIIDRVTHSDVKFTTAYFSARQVKDRAALETRYNLSPSLAMFDDYMILSSSEGLTRDLIAALKSPASGTQPELDQTHTLLRLAGSQLGSVLKSNREQMVRQNMVDKGHTQEQAEIEIDTLLTLVQYLDGMNLEVGKHDGRPQAVLVLKTRLPQIVAAN